MMDRVGGRLNATPRPLTAAPPAAGGRLPSTVSVPFTKMVGEPKPPAGHDFVGVGLQLILDRLIGDGDEQQFRIDPDLGAEALDDVIPRNVLVRRSK